MTLTDPQGGNFFKTDALRPPELNRSILLSILYTLMLVRFYMKSADCAGGKGEMSYTMKKGREVVHGEWSRGNISGGCPDPTCLYLQAPFNVVTFLKLVKKENNYRADRLMC